MYSRVLVPVRNAACVHVLPRLSVIDEMLTVAEFTPTRTNSALPAAAVIAGNASAVTLFAAAVVCCTNAIATACSLPHLSALVPLPAPGSPSL